MRREENEKPPHIVGERVRGRMVRRDEFMCVYMSACDIIESDIRVIDFMAGVFVMVSVMSLGMRYN